MSCQVKDVLVSLGADGTTHAVPRAIVSAVPTTLPFSLKSGSAYNFVQNPQPSCQTDLYGNWSLTLPWPSESNPNTEQWQLTFPDGTVWQGTVPEGIAGPLTLWQLRNTYNWSQVVTAASMALVGAPVTFTGSIPATTQYGLLNVGNGPFDGVSAGHFVGGPGTVIAINTASTYVGGLVDLQVAGSRRFGADTGGHMLFGGPSPTISNILTGIASVVAYPGTVPTDARGMLRITVGNANVAPGASAICTVNFANAYSVVPSVVLTPMGATSPARLTQVPSTSAFAIYAPVDTLSANGIYDLAYTVLG